MTTHKHTKEKTFDPYDFSQKIIGGVPVYYKKIPTAPCIHIHVCFNVGACNDPEKAVGISHFLEHMIFDGSPLLSTKKDIEQWSKLYTLKSWNAWTSLSHTNYHLRCLPEHFDTVLTGMKDMIFYPLLRADDVEHERNVITQEAWGRYKNEKLLTYIRESIDNMYHGTLRNKTFSPLGWPESIARISQKDIVEWHKKKYGVGNFFIVLGGAIDEKNIKKIKTFIAGLPKASTSGENFGTLRKPKKLSITKTGDEIGDPREQVEVSFNRSVVVSENFSREINVLSQSLLQDILFERMRTERALCYGVTTRYFHQRDFAQWIVDIKADEKNKDIILVEFWKALKDIISGKEEKRFQTLKQVSVDRIKSSEEVTADVTENILSDISRYGKVATKNSLLAKRKKVTYADVVSCLSHAFDAKWTVTEVIMPTKK